MEHKTIPEFISIKFFHSTFKYKTIDDIQLCKGIESLPQTLTLLVRLCDLVAPTDLILHKRIRNANSSG